MSKLNVQFEIESVYRGYLRLERFEAPVPIVSELTHLQLDGFQFSEELKKRGFLPTNIVDQDSGEILPATQFFQSEHNKLERERIYMTDGVKCSPGAGMPAELHFDWDGRVRAAFDYGAHGLGRKAKSKSWVEVFNNFVDRKKDSLSVPTESVPVRDPELALFVA